MKTKNKIVEMQQKADLSRFENLGKSQKIIPGVTEWELKNLNKHIILILFLFLIPNMILKTTNAPSPDDLLVELNQIFKVSYQKRFLKDF